MLDFQKSARYEHPPPHRPPPQQLRPSFRFLVGGFVCVCSPKPCVRRLCCVLLRMLLSMMLEMMNDDNDGIDDDDPYSSIRSPRPSALADAEQQLGAEDGEQESRQSTTLPTSTLNSQPSSWTSSLCTLSPMPRRQPNHCCQGLRASAAPPSGSLRPLSFETS